MARNITTPPAATPPLAPPHPPTADAQEAVEGAGAAATVDQPTVVVHDEFGDPVAVDPDPVDTGMLDGAVDAIGDAASGLVDGPAD